MPPKKIEVTYTDLMKDIQAKKFSPIYILEGEEAFFIDQIEHCIVENALTEDEKDFNLTVVYGPDTDIREVITTCKQYPTMATRRVVVVREAQLVGKLNNKRNDVELDLLHSYATRPLTSTVLVLCNKEGSFKGKEVKKAVNAYGTGLIFTSNKISGRNLDAFIVGQLATGGYKIDDKATAMLTEAIGNDLSLLHTTLEKLKLVSTQTKEVTPAMIERNVGISKDYNSFELEDAIIDGNLAKAFKISSYFKKNPKNNPVPMIIATLFSFYANLLIVHTTVDKSDPALMAALGTRSAFRIRKFRQASQAYSVRAVIRVIALIRECDLRSKGQGSRQNAYDLFNDLIYRIFALRGH